MEESKYLMRKLNKVKCLMRKWKKNDFVLFKMQVFSDKQEV